MTDPAPATDQLQVSVSGPPSEDDGDAPLVAVSERAIPQLWEKGWDKANETLQGYVMRAPAMSEVLLKSFRTQDGTTSGQDVGIFNTQVKVHPFNMGATKLLIRDNNHHSTCIHTKVYASVGQGFVTEEMRNPTEPELDPTTGAPKKQGKKPRVKSRVAQLLDPISGKAGFDSVMTCVAYDYFQTGNGYMEVVRDADGSIVGIFHIPCEHVHIVIEDAEYHQHFLIGDGSSEALELKVFAEFGDLDGLRERMGQNQFHFLGTARSTSPEQIKSEVIHFKMPNSLNRWYGFPDWLSAAASIELVQMLTQESYDFFHNRGVPEFMLFMLGQALSEKNWSKVQAAIRSTVGPGNSHKTLALNIPDREMKVQVEKLALDSKTGGAQFKEMGEVLGLDIVTAHRIPPVLGNIVIPGKMAASNEITNALLVTQVLVVGPAQKVMETVLGLTLGSSDAGLGLTPEDFEFVKITDVIAEGIEALKPADTMARMRQELPQAASEGRDLEDGLKKLKKKLEGLGYDGDLSEDLKHNIAAARVSGAAMAGLLDFVKTVQAAA